MKDLEAAAASLEPVQRRLAHAEDLLVDTNLVCHCGLLAYFVPWLRHRIYSSPTNLHKHELKIQSLEAAQIEITALRTALKSLSAVSRHSALTPLGTLALETETERSTDNQPERIDIAFDILAQQSRELAKRNRAKRDHEEYIQQQMAREQNQQV